MPQLESSLTTNSNMEPQVWLRNFNETSEIHQKYESMLAVLQVDPSAPIPWPLLPPSNHCADFPTAIKAKNELQHDLVAAFLRSRFVFEGGEFTRAYVTAMLEAWQAILVSMETAKSMNEQVEMQWTKRVWVARVCALLERCRDECTR